MKNTPLRHPLIRPVTEDDAEQIQAIYSPIVKQTVISFETNPPTVDEMRQRVVQANLPWLVCEDQGTMLGYVYAAQHRTRAAYQWSVDVSVYTHPNARRRGVGRALYSSLFKILTLQGFRNAYAGIALPNPASVGLHEALGFQPIGVYKAVGYKFDTWHDVGWWQLSLGSKNGPPHPPFDLETVLATKEGKAALAAGLSLLRV
jgi:phosphinothricin acetyltransferase